MFIFENLLRNEYFPSELPPCFNTDSLANNSNQLKTVLEEVHINKYTQPVTFSGYKNANARRKFAIPNPYHYCKAVDAIVNNSEEIFKVLRKSKSSLTCPLNNNPKADECYCKPTKNISQSKQIIEQLYQNNIYEIRLDIASFFDSIYTHSVPWAIHTKAIAKKNKTEEYFGNALDDCLQNMNYGQTNGVLVGNAVSRIISEIILCVVDDNIQKRLPHITYKRYVDDYYIYIKSSLEINSIVSVFRQELAKYELTLNENKIEINESPFIYGKPWVEQMKESLSLKPEIFLSKMIIQYNRYKDISIFKYGLKVIEVIKYKAEDWKCMQSNLINLWVRFPSLSSYFVTIFKCNENLVSKKSLKKAIYSIIENNLELKNDQEVIWAVWASKVFDIDMSQPFIEKILKSENWLAIIIMLDIIKCKRLRLKPNINKYLNSLYNEIVEEYIDNEDNKDIMYSEIWLLAYEADKNKWLNLDSNKQFNFARKNEFFKKLKELEIEFYIPDFNNVNQQPNKVRNSNNNITQQSFVEAITKLQNSIISRVDENGDKKLDLNNEERNIIEIIHNVAISNDY